MSIDFIAEMNQDFFDYCYQTNSERAFAAIDGLKPGQRACLYEMYRKGYTPNKAHVKSAKVSGGVIAELWPHGDTAIYETFARMAQSFTNNNPLCEFHGSCGNQIIPEAAASRYTEVRLSKLGMDMFEGIKKKNVPFILNFDESIEWPEVLPTPIPMLMINGSEGIGTTIAQKWLPYNFTEVSTAFRNYIATGKIDYTLAPDFPTGGTIINQKDLPVILKTGKGKVILRATAEIKDNTILITEICYQTCVRDLMEEFKKLYDADELPGIADIQNNSGKRGICIKIICEKTANPAQVLNMLYKKTALQKSYSANQNILVGKIPEMATLERYFKMLYEHNDACLVREHNYDKNKAALRKEECEGLLIAIANIDDIIAIVRASDNKTIAKEALIDKYKFTSHQADCILKMTIGQLTKLDGIKIEDELKELVSLLDKLNNLLKDENLRKENLIEIIDKLIKKYPTARRTALTHIEITKEEKKVAEVVPEDVMVVTTQSGFIKRVPIANFKPQKRGGKGIKNKDDMILDVVKTNTVDYMMFFTNKGKMYRTVVDNIPTGTNTTKGTMINELIKVESNETIMAVTSLHREKLPKFIIFITKNGIVKKSYLEDYMGVKKNAGIAAITLKENDSVAEVLFQNDEELLLITKNGMSIRFETKDISAIGRTAQGIKGIKLNEGDEIVAGMSIHKTSDSVAIFTKTGLGKKVALSEFTKQARGGKGLIIYKDGIIAGATMVSDEDNILVIGTKSSIAFSAKELPLIGRIGMGNIVIKDNNIKSIAKFK